MTRALIAADESVAGEVVAQGANWYRRYLDLQIQSIQQRAGQPASIASDLSGATDTVFGAVAIIATGTGIHGGDKHKPRRKPQRAAGAGHGDMAILERLPQTVERGTAEFASLIQK